jgi:hypothetical protein
MYQFMVAWFSPHAFGQVSGLFDIQLHSIRTAWYRHVLVDSLEVLLELVLSPANLWGRGSTGRGASSPAPSPIMNFTAYGRWEDLASSAMSARCGGRDVHLVLGAQEGMWGVSRARVLKLAAPRLGLAFAASPPSWLARQRQDQWRARGQSGGTF